MNNCNDRIPPELEDIDPGNLQNLGGVVSEIQVALRFFGDDLNPDELSSSLCCTPTESHEKGEIIEEERYDRTASTGSWILYGTTGTGDSVEAQIISLFSRVSDDVSVWNRLTRDFEADIFCGLFLDGWNQGLELSSTVLSEIVQRGLCISLDIYCRKSEVGSV